MNAPAPTPAFHYEDTFHLAHNDATEYRLLTKDGISTATFDEREILRVDPAALTRLAREAFHDCSFMLRPAHLAQVT